MPNTERQLLLEKLLNFEQPAQQTLAELQKFGWHSDEDRACLMPAHIANLLDGYLKGKLNPRQIEEWTNALECRADLGFMPGKKDLMRRTIFQLANPLLNKPIAPERARSLKVQLSQ
jgi:hypothetical protein